MHFGDQLPEQHSTALALWLNTIKKVPSMQIIKTDLTYSFALEELLGKKPKLIVITSRNKLSNVSTYFQGHIPSISF